MLTHLYFYFKIYLVLIFNINLIYIDLNDINDNNFLKKEVFYTKSLSLTK